MKRAGGQYFAKAMRSLQDDFLSARARGNGLLGVANSKHSGTPITAHNPAEVDSRKEHFIAAIPYLAISYLVPASRLLED